MVLFSAGAAPAFAQFRVEVTGVGMTQVPLAILPFRGEGRSEEHTSELQSQ